MTGRTVPEPPDPFDPLWEPLPADTRIFRVHEPRLPDGSANDGTLFNPGFGSAMRWSFFGDPVVPVHYSAASPEAAVHESILHDAVPHGHLPRSRWIGKVLTPLITRRELRLGQLRSDGLRRLGVRWMSRQLTSTRGYCFFGDRVAPGDLEALPGDPDSRIFATPADSEWLHDVALRMRVSVRPVV